MPNIEGSPNEQMMNGFAEDFFRLCFGTRHSLSLFVISSCISQHFFNRCVACENATQAVLAQCDHSELDRFLLYGDGRRALVDQFTDRISNLQKLVNSFSSFVTGVVTSVAPFAVKELFLAEILPRDAELCQQGVVRPVRSAAVSTDAAQQPLPKDGLQSGRNKEWFRAHVDQTRDRARRIIGVERSKNQMARKRRLNCNLSRLQITRFSNHDAIRILPQEVAQNSSKGQADAFIHRHLHDSLKIVLNGLLSSDQLRINGVDLAQTGVKRRCL